MSLGYDVQARNLLRGLRERVDVFSCCALSNEFSEDFLSAQTVQDSNKFWHRRVSKGKARRYLSEKFSERTGEPGLLDSFWADWRNDTEAMLGASEHTFHVAGFVATFPRVGKGNGEYGLDGLPSSMSFWTVRTSLHFLWELLMVCRLAFPELRDGTFEVEGEANRDLNATIKVEYPRHFKFLMQTHSAYWGDDWLASNLGRS